MCIAAVIFKPVSLKYLVEMDTDNPHGGGVACVKEGRIWFLKGLDAKAIFALQEAEVLTYPYLLHFRWATQGSRIAENCHPFPIGPRALMGETVGFAERVLIHNGTWHTYNRHIPLSSEIPQKVLEHVSDTAIAAWLLQDNPDILDEVPWATAVAEMKDGEIDITTRGTWTDHQGNWYSNLSWLPSSETNWDKWWDTSKWNRPAPNQYNPKPMTQSIAPSVSGIKGPPDRANYDDREGEEEDLNGTNPDAWENSPLYESWEDYVRAKYGDEAAELVMADTSETASDEEDNAAMRAMGISPRTRDGQTLEEALADLGLGLDLISEDADTVNSYLAKQMLKGAA
jgi:hypothetical protein